MRATRLVSLQAIDPIYESNFFLPQQQISRITRKETVGRHDRRLARAGIQRESVGRQLHHRLDHAQYPGRGRRSSILIVLCCPGCMPRSTCRSEAFSASLRFRRRRSPTTHTAAAVYLAQPGPTPPNQTQPPTSDAAPSLVASQTFVTLGPTRGDQVAIVKGIKEGDTVVTSGQMKLLRPGTPLIRETTRSCRATIRTRRPQEQ